MAIQPKSIFWMCDDAMMFIIITVVFTCFYYSRVHYNTLYPAVLRYVLSLSLSLSAHSHPRAQLSMYNVHVYVYDT